uniref:glucuronosyltransferase n=1 Tax=Setaria digitata TaxID=48799 RepID=A0A915PIN1_9BILA
MGVTLLLNHEVDSHLIADIPNIISRNDIPQKDLLDEIKIKIKFAIYNIRVECPFHANLRALITECDRSTVLEAAYAGVPLICVPLSVEQMRNSRIAQWNKIAIIIDGAAARRNLVQKKRGSKLAQMISDNPLSSREYLIRQVEYAIKFGPLFLMLPPMIDIFISTTF